MAEDASTSLLDRTFASLRRALRDRGGRRETTVLELRPDLPDVDAEQLLQQMRVCLDGRGGAVSARARAAALGRAYLSLSKTGRHKFLSILAANFDPDRVEVDAACQAVATAETQEERRDAESRLSRALQPPRLRLLTQFNALQDGVKFLVDMRAEAMSLGRRDKALKVLDTDLRHLLAGWFDVGFLELRRIAWSSPANLLEKLIAYEAVHEIRGWRDLKNRLDSDRRCYAFFHPRMPDEPLIFVEVALVEGMAGDVHALLDEAAPVEDPSAADTAIFYSISNAQRGLAGISFGDFLIKRVVDALAADFKNLRTFATLSPIPGFRAWLEGRLAEEGDALLTEGERADLTPPDGAEDDGGSRLGRALATADWHTDMARVDALRAPLTRLCARYLLREKRPDGRALDPVAHFHLSNGARMERLNWLGDTSPNGLKQSYGMMINYLYKLDAIEPNHEAYSGERRVVAASVIRALAA